MNYFTLLQQIKKIKASLAILIGNNSKVIEEAKQLYIKSSTIYLDE